MNCELIKTYDELAEREPPIGAESLLIELLPLMEEFFIGDISINDHTILYRMPNGPQFRIVAQKA